MIQLIIILFGVLNLCLIGMNPYQNVELKEYQEFTSIDSTAMELQRLYQLNISDSYGLYEIEYFDFFPNSFDEFNEVFGYEFENETYRITRRGALYSESMNHINLFFGLNKIEVDTFIFKVISIGINGKWEADAVGIFQHNMIAYIKQDVLQFSKILNEFSKNEISSFWYFYFDGPHPVESIPVELLVLENNDPQMYSLMCQSFKQVHQDNPHQH